MMLAVLIFLGVTAKGQEIPSRIQEVFDATNIETTFYKEGWYRYDVSSADDLISLQNDLFESCESWSNAPLLWEELIVAREFDYDDWVVILAVIEKEQEGYYEIVGDIMQKGIAVNQ